MFLMVEKYVVIFFYRTSIGGVCRTHEGPKAGAVNEEILFFF